MGKAVLLPLSVAITAALMAGYASKPAQTQASATQTREAQTQAAGQSEAPREESKETEVKTDGGKVYELHTSSNQAQSGTIGHALEFFYRAVEGKSGGKIKTTANFENELGSQSEWMEVCQADTLEMVATAPGTGSGVWVPELQVFEFPFLFRNNEEYHEVIKVMEPEVSKRLEQHGFVACGEQSMGAGDILTAAPVTELEDMKGFKMRSPNSICISVFDCLGASSTTMDWDEVYTAFQTKVMDGMEASPPMVNSMKFQDSAKNLAVTSHCVACIVYFFNKGWYDSLPRDLQQIIMESVNEAVACQVRIDDEDNDKALEEMKTEGVVITEIQDIDEWKEACTPMLEEYRAEEDNQNSFIDVILKAQK